MAQSNLPAVISKAAQLQKIDPDSVNMMLPSETYGAVIGEFDRVTLEVVRVDPNPDNGDVFPIDGKLSLGKVPLQKISSALSIQWDPDRTGIVSESEKKCTARAVGAMRKPNGELVTVTDTKTIDLAVEEERLRIKYEEDSMKGNFTKDVIEWGQTAKGKRFPAKFTPWENDAERVRTIDLQVRKNTLQKRTFMHELALTGAKNRVIKAFIGVKSSYTEQELSKPFAFPRVITDTAKMMQDPEMKRIAMDRMSGAVSSLFGPNERDVTPAPQSSVAQLERPSEQEAEEHHQTIVEDDDEPFTLEAESTGSEKTEEQKRREDLAAKLEEWALSYDNHGQPKAAQSLRAIAADDSTDIATLESYLNSAADRAQKAGW